MVFGRHLEWRSQRYDRQTPLGSVRQGMEEGRRSKRERRAALAAMVNYAPLAAHRCYARAREEPFRPMG
jgi:hypothetical protein